jgi:hypothetical protein
MKKLFILLGSLLTATIINAQNVAINNDGTSAATSAMLDVKSTTKGMLMPRMTSAQRTAITSPALGLMVFDTDTKTLWVYDGSSWKNLYTSGGALTLPFSQSVNTAISAFQVTNQGTGTAIEGTSSAEFGIGMTAKATGAASWGLFAYSNGAGSQSIRSYADNGTAFHGETNNPANTSNLMYLLNQGAGITSRFQLANSNSTAANVLIAGNHLGNQLKIYQTNTANSQDAVSIENSGTGAGIKSVSANNAVGILGVSSTGYGVKGETNSGIGFAGVLGTNTGTAGSGVAGFSNTIGTVGVYGSSTNGTGVRGTSSTGTGVNAVSTSGLALDVNGNLKIAGGNTNPSAGAVLTSDANGNAVWKHSKIGFRGQGSDLSYNSNLNPNQDYTVFFKNESYDYGNNFFPNDQINNIYSAFVVPVNGVYNFKAKLFAIVNGAEDDDGFDATIKIAVIHNGVLTFPEDMAPYSVSYNPSNPPQVLAYMQVSAEMHLSAGDKVFIVFNHTNDVNAKAVIGDYNDLSYFHGRLVIPD